MYTCIYAGVRILSAACGPAWIGLLARVTRLYELAVDCYMSDGGIELLDWLQLGDSFCSLVEVSFVI